MMKIRIFLFALFFLGCFCSASFSSETENDILNKARQSVEEKSYDEALKFYESISGWLNNNPDLLIEWARVYTYADRHDGAIALFERVRTDYPQKEKEIIKELADQYKWNGQFKKAIEIYGRAEKSEPSNIEIKLGLAQALAWDNQHKKAINEYDAVLALNPDSVNALLGKAEVLSWGDKLEQAEKLYQQVLAREPKNINALNGMARISVWQGYLKQGIEKYQDILKENPSNPDALEGIAFAYHWDGQDALALDTLKELLALYPDRHAAKDLYAQIKNIRTVHITQSNRSSYDTNKLDINSNGLHAGRYIDDYLVIGASYERGIYRQENMPSLNFQRGGIDINRRFTPYLAADSYMYVSGYDDIDFTPFTTNTWITIMPNDLLRFYLGYDRETFEDITALHNEIIVNSSSISLDLKPNRFWLLSAQYKTGEYSDDNRQNTFFSKVEYRLTQNPYIKLYYNYYYSDWADQKYNGYFNPNSIDSYSFGIYASKNLTDRLFAEAQASGGYERQDPKANRPTHSYNIGLTYNLSDNWALSLRGEYFDALDKDPDNEYSKTTGWFIISYSFGPEPGMPHKAQQPQRPTAQ